MFLRDFTDFWYKKQYILTVFLKTRLYLGVCGQNPLVKLKFDLGIFTKNCNWQWTVSCPLKSDLRKTTKCDHSHTLTITNLVTFSCLPKSDLDVKKQAFDTTWGLFLTSRSDLSSATVWPQLYFDHYKFCHTLMRYLSLTLTITNFVTLCCTT